MAVQRAQGEPNFGFREHQLEAPFALPPRRFAALDVLHLDVQAIHLGGAMGIARQHVTGEDRHGHSGLGPERKLPGRDRLAEFEPSAMKRYHTVAHRVRDDQVLQLLSQGFLLAVAIDPFAGAVPEHDPPLAVVALNRDVRNLLHHPAKARFALVQGLDQRPMRGHVDQYARQAGYGATAIAQHRGRVANGDLAPIGIDHPVFDLVIQTQRELSRAQIADELPVLGMQVLTPEILGQPGLTRIAEQSLGAPGNLEVATVRGVHFPQHDAHPVREFLYPAGDVRLLAGRDHQSQAGEDEHGQPQAEPERRQLVCRPRGKRPLGQTCQPDSRQPSAHPRLHCAPFWSLAREIPLSGGALRLHRKGFHPL